MLALAAASLAGIAAAPPAAAATTITVTTTDDVIDGGDGLTSLREAIDTSNTTDDDTIIVLATDAIYALTICGPGGTGLAANSQGDLNPARADAGAYTVTIQGNGATIDQTCPETRHLRDLRPGPVASLTLHDLTLTGGAATSDDGETPPGYAASITSTAGLTLDGVDIVDAVAKPFESSPEGPSPAAVVVDGSGPLSVNDSTITGTVLGAAIVDLRTAGVSTITGSMITDNDGNEAIGAIAALHRPVVISDTTISDNHNDEGTPPSGPPADPDDLGNIDPMYAGAVYAGDVTITNSILERNLGVYGGAVHAVTADISGSMFRHNGAFAGGAVRMANGSVTNSSFVENSGGLAGGGIYITTCEFEPCPTSAVAIESSTFDGNLASGGGGVAVWGPRDPMPSASIHRSTFTRNQAYGGAAIQVVTPVGDVSITESTMAGNQRATFLAITAPAAELTVNKESVGDPTPSVSVRGSVVAATEPAMQSCELTGAAALTSDGHNFASDGSCGFGAGTDQNSGGDPLLGALADNGGATETMLPEPGSPLIDAIPPATPGCAGATAQNALALPQGSGCDIGAAERPSSAVLAGHVTSAHDGTPLAGIEVRVRAATNTYATATTTAPDGTWTVTGLPAGTYKVLFRDPTGDYQQTFNGNAKQFATAPAIATTTTDTTIVDQSLAAANTVSGTITDSVTGDPIPGAEARLRNAADNTFVATAKANGSGVYTFTNLAPGTYKIAFRDPTGAHTQIFNGSAPGFATAPPIPVAPGDTLTIDQAMDPVPTIGGTITDTVSGLPLAGIDVRVRDLTNNYVAGATTAPDGTWTIHLTPGTYKLWFNDPTGDHLAEWHLDKPGFATATPITHTTTQTITTALTPTGSVSPAP